MYTPQRFRSHLQYVATLPCENRKCKNVTDFDNKLLMFQGHINCYVQHTDVLY